MADSEALVRTKNLIQVWRNNPAYFAETVLNIKLLPHQKVLIHYMMKFKKLYFRKGVFFEY